jgi:hypothetical protein
MGLFDHIENKLEGFVNGAFVRAVKGDLKPADIQSSMQRLLASQATPLAGGRKLAPNEFTVSLNKHDYDRLAPYSKTLNAEIIPTLREHASAYSLVFNGAISIAYVLDESLPSGKFAVTAETRAHVIAQGAAVGGQRSDVITGPTNVPGNRASAAAGSGASAAASLDPATSRRMTERVSADGTGRAGADWTERAGADGVRAGLGTDPNASIGTGAGTGTGIGTGHEGSAGSATRNPAASPHLALVLEVNGVRHPLVPPGFSIGRGTEADLRVSDPSISRKHAQIIVEGTPGNLTIKIVDLGSRNGIKVNGEKVLESPLTRGSRIEIGSTRMLVHASHGES